MCGTIGARRLYEIRKLADTSVPAPSEVVKRECLAMSYAKGLNM